MWLFAFLVGSVAGNYPVFDATTQMKNLLVPADLPVGSVIYRLRATDADRDYPLVFDATDYGSYVIRIENLPCHRNTTHCDANVYLERVLVAGQVFKFRLTVKDTKGLTSTLPVSIHATNARTDVNAVFPHIPGLIVVPEDTKVGTELEYVIVRKNVESKKPAMLELWGTTEFAFRQTHTSKETTTGIIVLAQPLDFERRTMYKLWVFATDMFVEIGRDSRNIAGFELVIVVQDVQDTPPIFQQYVNPVTKLRSTMKEGDLVTRVTAIDGDRGNPRPIKYGLEAEGNPFTVFFNIDRSTGEIFLAKPLKELNVIARSHQPILLTVVAEEEAVNPKEPPAQSSTITLALLLGEAGNTPPYFDNPSYVCRLNENSLQGTALVFSEAYSTQVHDDDMGKQGVFSLSIDGLNGTFEIAPTVAERHANFMIRVRNSALLDYEQRHSLQFVIVAKELGSETRPFSSTASVLVYLNDVNDNPPQFMESQYVAYIPENITANSKVAQVNATDKDEGVFANVHYTGILGFKNTSLMLDPLTGEIKIVTNNHGFDREEAAEYRFLVEARDMEGIGLRSTVPLILKIIDINDETPSFERSPTQFILTPDLKNFSERAFIKAIDRDAEPPNNIVKYEIISGNYENKFAINPDTGELTVRNGFPDSTRSKRQVNNVKSNVHVLTVRAYDLGVPHRSATSQIRIYPHDSGARTMTFIMPGINLDWRATEELLSLLTGGRISIQNMQPYNNAPSARINPLPSNPPGNTDKSIITATVSYNQNPVVDVSHLQDRLTINRTAVVVNQSVQEVRAENTVLLWLLILLAFLLLLALLSFLLCALCPCCPFYTLFTRQRKVHSAETTERRQFLQESKGVQVAGDEENKNQHLWYYGRAKAKKTEPAYIVLTTQRPTSPSSTATKRVVISERPLRNHNEHQQIDKMMFSKGATSNHVNPTADHIYLEDIADESDYHVLDPSKLSMQNNHRINDAINHRINIDADQDSFRRHEVERGSDIGGQYDRDSLETAKHTEIDPRVYQIRNMRNIENRMKDNFLGEPSKYYESNSEHLSRTDKDRKSHEEMFIKEGNAEILRLRTRETRQNQETDTVVDLMKDEHEEEPIEEIGKNLLMRRFIDEQNGDEMTNINHNLLSNNLLLTRYFIEEQQRSNRNKQAVDTQSLPGNTMLSMATQTDCNQSTQTEALYMMRPPRRKAKSDCGDSSDSDNEKEPKRPGRLVNVKFNSNLKNQSHPIKSPIIEESESSPESFASKHLKNRKQNALPNQSLHSNSSRSLTDLQSSKFYEEQREILGSVQNLSESKRSSKTKKSKEHVFGLPTEESSSATGLKKSRSCAEIIHPEVLEKQLRIQDYMPKSLKARFLSRNRNIAGSCQNIVASDVSKSKLNESKQNQVQGSRYMEWHKTRGNVRKKNVDDSKIKSSSNNLLHNSNAVPQRPASLKAGLRDTSNYTMNEKPVPKSASVVAVKMSEDEIDSGIVMSSQLKGSQPIVHKHQDLLEKKSVFTIAYGDVETKQIQPDSSSSPP